jgi:pimeloyl-ACP methyl ester carboxylesterase
MREKGLRDRYGSERVGLERVGELLPGNGQDGQAFVAQANEILEVESRVIVPAAVSQHGGIRADAQVQRVEGRLLVLRLCLAGAKDGIGDDKLQLDVVGRDSGDRIGLPRNNRGVLPLPVSALRSAGPVLKNPLNRGKAITLTLDQFKYGWANALDEKEAKQLYDTFHVAGSGIALVQMGNANLNPWTEAKVNTTNPDRGPLLIIDGEKDHTVPWAIANAAYKRQRRNSAVTEIMKIPNRGHSLTIDHGWREVAQPALDFVQRFA